METTLLVKQEVFVYQIPPRTTAKGYRADEWNLSKPMWTGRLKLLAAAGDSVGCNIRLEDRESGQLFANCPVDSYPGASIEAVTDSSRYFVLRMVGDGDRTAFLGVGFGDRSDSFDLCVTLQDHFKWAQRDQEQQQQQTADRPAPLDLGFKDGQTIKINMKITKKNPAGRHGNQNDDDDDDDEDGSGGATTTATTAVRPLVTGGAASGGGLLPPPPSAPASNRVASGSLSPTSAEAPGPASGASTPSGGVSSNWVQF